MVCAAVAQPFTLPQTGLRLLRHPRSAEWTGEPLVGGGQVVAAASLERIPVWVRRGALVVTYPAERVAAGLGDTPERDRPLEATLWGQPPGGRAAARLADDTVVRWTRGAWSVAPERPVTFRQHEA